MKVVLEEIEGDIARFIPDNGQPPLHASVTQLPKNYKAGDVFEYYLIDDKPHFTKLSDETEQRLNRIKAKRQALLNRSKDKK